ncbi:hypothetical protein cypCar_00034767 [Cyprinus carpio]|nr:hypothetical protein cypCar_00034767 [Cyprinus carpio]
MANTGLQVMGLVLGRGWLGVRDPVLCRPLVRCRRSWGRAGGVSGSAQMCRTLCVLSLLLCLLALMLSVTGLKCTRCLGDAHETKARLVLVGAALFLAAAFFFLLPVCWTAYVVIRDFYDPNIAAPLKRELGPALYLGWGVTVLLAGGRGLAY